MNRRSQVKGECVRFDSSKQDHQLRRGSKSPDLRSEVRIFAPRFFRGEDAIQVDPPTHRAGCHDHPARHGQRPACSTASTDTLAGTTQEEGRSWIGWQERNSPSKSHSLAQRKPAADMPRRRKSTLHEQRNNRHCRDEHGANRSLEENRGGATKVRQEEPAPSSPPVVLVTPALSEVE